MQAVFDHDGEGLLVHVQGDRLNGNGQPQGDIATERLKYEEVQETNLLRGSPLSPADPVTGCAQFGRPAHEWHDDANDPRGPTLQRESPPTRRPGRHDHAEEAATLKRPSEYNNGVNFRSAGHSRRTRTLAAPHACK